MSVLVFIGPTLDLDHAKPILDAAVYLPPAQQGDVYRAASVLGPRAIGIVDGYFRQSPAVWHKEILWCLQQGITVFGASSMGALRAAELAPFGMRGVGRVFQAYSQGVFAPFFDEVFEDDDEVAVAHAPAEAGYISSEALVNIRATLARAEKEQIIARLDRDALLRTAKTMFFPERSFANLITRARAQGLDSEMLESFAQWLPHGKVDQKRDDALELLQVMATHDERAPPESVKDFVFQRTTHWEHAVTQLSREAQRQNAALDELRLKPVLYRHCVHEATRALLALPDVTHADGIGDLGSNIRVACGLDSRTRVLDRLADAQCEPEEQLDLLDAEIRSNTLCLDARQVPRTIRERHLMQVLERDDLLDELAARGHAKHEALTARHPSWCAEDLNDLQLLDLRIWFFEEILNMPYPGSVDSHIERLGFDSSDEFHRVALGERLYRELGEASGE